jgi:GST-like protein
MQADLDFYFSPTANCRRAAIMLEACGLPYRLHAIDRARGDQKQPGFLALNPAGAVPLLIDHGASSKAPLVLAQSAAIMVHLAERTGLYLPKEPVSRAVTFQWLFQATTDVNPAVSMVFLSDHVFAANEETCSFLRDRLRKFLLDCDQRLKDRRFLADELTIADFALYPAVEAQMPRVKQWAELENLRRWANDMQMRDDVQRAMALK